MEFWNILGIEPTDDKEKIKKAYIEKLNIYHPEEDPEGFRKLRDSYENALKYNSEAKKEQSETDIFMDEVRALYSNFYKRIDKNNWYELLSRDICENIDTEFDICKAIFNFLARYYYLPHEIFKFIADKFLWEEREDELKQSFNPNMIDYMMNRSRYNDNIDYYMFEGAEDADYDGFISLFFEIDNLMYDRKLDNLEESFQKLNSLEIYNPDARILEARFNVYKLRVDNAQKIIDELMEKYDKNESVFFAAANVAVENKEFDKALEYFDKAAEIRGNTEGMNVHYGDCYFGKGDYVKAKEYYRNHLLAYQHNAYAREKFYYTNQKLIEYYEEKIKTDDSQEVIYQLAAAYFNCNDYEKSLEIFKKYNPPEDKIDRYFEFLVDLHTQLQNLDEALKASEDWEMVNPDNKNLLMQKAYILYRLKRYDELTAVYEKGMKMFPEEPSFYHTKALKYFDLNELENSAEVIHEGLKHAKNFLAFYSMLADIEFKFGHYSEALDNARIALNIYPYLVDMYNIQSKIYYDVADYDSVISVANTVEGFNYFHEEIALNKVMALNKIDETEKAKEMILRLLEKDQNNAVYLCEYSKVLSNEKNYEGALLQINKALEIEPKNIYNIMTKAKYLKYLERYSESIDLFRSVQKEESNYRLYAYNEEGLVYLKQDKYDEAIKTFEEVIRIDPQTTFGYLNIADCYYYMKNYEKAIEYYEKQLEFTEEGHIYTSLGLSYSYSNNTEKEREYYQKSIEVDPDYAYAYNNMGYLSYLERRYDEAIEFYNTAIEKNKYILSAHRYLGYSYRAKRDFEKAIEIYNEALNVFTEGRDRRLVIEDKAYVYFFTDRFNESIAVFKKALDENLESGYIYDMIGTAYYNLRDYKNALKYFNDGLKKFENYEDLSISMGDYYFKIERDFKKALEYYLKATSSDNKDYRHLLKLAVCQEKLASKKAESNYKLALELLEETFKKEDEPERACYYVAYGNIYLGLNDYEKALEYFNLAIERAQTYELCFSQKCDRAYFGIGNLYKKQGDIQKALEHYDRAYEIKAEEEFLIEKNELLNPKKKSFFSFFKKK